MFRKWIMGNQKIRDLATTILMIMFAVIALLSLASVFDANSKVVVRLDTRMHHVADISSYGAMLYAAFALLIATVSLKLATQRPELVLDFLNGTKAKCLRAEIHKNSHLVLPLQETAHWQMWLTNEGTASAHYPVVRIVFENVRLEGKAIDGWQTVSNDDENTIIQWPMGNNDTIIHPKFVLKIPMLDLRGQNVAFLGRSDKRIKLLVTLASDGFYRDGIEWCIDLDDQCLNYNLEEWLSKNVLADQPVDLVHKPSFTANGFQLSYEMVMRAYKNRSVPPTYETLSALGNATWQPVFDEWEKRGYFR